VITAETTHNEIPLRGFPWRRHSLTFPVSRPFVFSGTYDDANATVCQSCPLGQFSDGVGLLSCAFCPAGLYGDAVALNSSACSGTTGIVCVCLCNPSATAVGEMNAQIRPCNGCISGMRLCVQDLVTARPGTTVRSGPQTPQECRVPPVGMVVEETAHAQRVRSSPSAPYLALGTRRPRVVAPVPLGQVTTVLRVLQAASEFRVPWASTAWAMQRCVRCVQRDDSETLLDCPPRAARDCVLLAPIQRQRVWRGVFLHHRDRLCQPQAARQPHFVLRGRTARLAVPQSQHHVRKGRTTVRWVRLHASCALKVDSAR
jgi:hypothetical protein